jgi:hypothetical protein
MCSDRRAIVFVDRPEAMKAKNNGEGEPPQKILSIVDGKNSLSLSTTTERHAKTEKSIKGRRCGDDDACTPRA